MQELAYTNNPNSLFRKYAPLITGLTKHQLFRDYISHKNMQVDEPVALLLPNGFIKVKEQKKEETVAQLIVTTRAVYAPKLYPALYALDLAAMFLRDMREAERFLLGNLGLINSKEFLPLLLKLPHFTVRNFNPDANPETTSVDGWTERSGVSQTWANIRAGAGVSANDTDTGGSLVNIRMNNNTGGDVYAALHRSFTLFDTSPLSAAAIISAATASLIKQSFNQSGGTPAVNMVICNPASNTGLVAADHNIANWTMTLQSDTEPQFNTAYQDFPLNATGLSNISKTGISKFGWVGNYDKQNSSPGTSVWDNRTSFYYSDNPSATKPQLAVTYIVPGGGSMLAKMIDPITY